MKKVAFVLKKAASILSHRVVLTAAAILLQLGLLTLLTVKFGEYFIPFHALAVALSVVAVLWIVNNRSNSGYKIAWIILILLFPLLGGILYLLLGGNKLTPGTRKRLTLMSRAMERTLKADYSAPEVTRTAGVTAGNHARYLENYGHCPAYRDTRCTYYPLGDQWGPALLQALEGARRYIFLEYFIIEPGELWDGVLTILKEKAAHGVEVRVIYDDIGCMYTLPAGYAKELGKFGIKCVDFNPFVPVLSTVLNNRDHRKICVVDGRVAFTGGVNLADEYINRKVKYGHWKDTAIRLEGPGAWSMTVMFLTMWDFATKTPEELEDFRPGEAPRYPGSGWVQPYTDFPWDSEPVGETVYLNLISRAKRYVYMVTPYLITDEAMNTALVAAAKSGVDVRLITPHIPDKQIIFQVTRAHYEPLLRGGVKIYEYTPGFAHAKCFAVDDRYGTVGSVNLDYRSLFLHFENGVLLTDSPVVKDIRDDFLATQALCQPYTLEDCRKVCLPLRLLRSLFRVFAPLF